MREGDVVDEIGHGKCAFFDQSKDSTGRRRRHTRLYCSAEVRRFLLLRALVAACLAPHVAYSYNMINCAAAAAAGAPGTVIITM